MKNTKVLDVLRAIADWQSGTGSLVTVCELLDDRLATVSQMLLLNNMCDTSYKPMGDFTYQEVVNAILLYLAMRQGLRQKA